MNAEYHRAFSLIELLTVIAIMAILIALVAPAVSGIGGANNLTVATQSLIDQLNKARQEAISRNRVVQVQFLKTSRNADSNAFRAVRSIVLNEAGLLCPRTPFARLWPSSARRRTSLCRETFQPMQTC